MDVARSSRPRLLQRHPYSVGEWRVELIFPQVVPSGARIVAGRLGFSLVELRTAGSFFRAAASSCSGEL